MTASLERLMNVIPVLNGRPEQHVLDFIRKNKPQIEQALSVDGVVMLRGFGAPEDDIVERALEPLAHELLDDAFWSTPRTGVSGKTFTATEYPKQRTILLHSEMAYMPAWPRLLSFNARQVADTGGETTICNLDLVSRDLDDLLPEFERRRVLYRRTYHPGIDVSWQKAFRVSDRSGVEAIAKIAHMDIEWIEGDLLRTSHTAQGCVRAEDGRLLWFNQAHLFHPTNVPAASLAMMLELFGADRLPRNALFGDGEEIPDATMRRVSETFDRHALKVAWKADDVLFVDNMRFAHGRMPFEGSRKLHVAMANQQSEPRRTPVFHGS